MADSLHRDGDRLIGFTLPGRGARGRVVRLDKALGEILAAHAYPEPIARLLGETLALTALLGALFRPEEGQLTLQAKGEGGPVRLLVADFRAENGEGALRGYAAQDLDRRFPPAATLETLFGRGQLVITLDQTASSERYQGIVALSGEQLQQAAQGYFEDSEQLPTLVRLSASQDADGRWTAGGLILQHMSRAEEGDRRLHLDEDSSNWDHVAALGGSVTEDELTDIGLPLESLLWRLFNEDEVRVLPALGLHRGCRCSTDHIRSVLAQFSEEDRAEMRNADGVISVDCEFCSRQFLMDV
ncbi:Hsp33 family molecular chaperone HslO [Sandaracinobacteroides hominis]|uniref:Hsp33 family molecular chaperone HslO n=1 Tax=Sandaracinobacteroides hominis TaxID=2780086 RepID=UPI0018F59915|nr:Hsp33 family molecular chaperone HslO [Sandaracinobacteroides hominis]